MHRLHSSHNKKMTSRARKRHIVSKHEKSFHRTTMKAAIKAISLLAISTISTWCVIPVFVLGSKSSSGAAELSSINTSDDLTARRQATVPTANQKNKHAAKPRAVVYKRSGTASPASSYPLTVRESALVDKESGRIYWQSGGPLMKITSDDFQIKHFKSSLLSFILFTCVITMLLVKKLFEKIAGPLPMRRSRSLLKSVALFLLKPRLTFFTLNPYFTILIYLIYLLESWNCSTRQYLSNVLSLENVEDQTEKMRTAKPKVTWSVRCYHFEGRKSMLASLSLKRRGKRSAGNEAIGSPSSGKKVITHRAANEYNVSSWNDNTVVGLWKRAAAFSPAVAPFTKISYSKILSLGTADVRDDYFKQQAEFISREGQKDEHAEFATNINVAEFKPKILATRTRVGSVSIHLFWLFTVIGLSSPYRFWFSRHCDELRVTLVKEVSLATPLPSSWASPSSSPSSSWSSWSLPTSFIPKALWSSSSKIVANAAAEENGRMEEEFRRQMLEYELYNEKRTTEVEQEAKRKSDETVQRTNSTSGNFTSFADNITTTDNGENGTSSVASPPPPLTETRTMMKTEQEKKLEQRQEEKKDSLQVAKFNSTSLENDVGGDHDNTSIINDGANTISLLGEMYNKKE